MEVFVMKGMYASVQMDFMDLTVKKVIKMVSSVILYTLFMLQEQPSSLGLTILICGNVQM